MMKKRTSAVKMKKNPTPAKKALKGKQGSLPKELKDAILTAPEKMLKPSGMKMMKQNSSMKMMKKKTSAVKMVAPKSVKKGKPSVQEKAARRKSARTSAMAGARAGAAGKAMMKSRKMIKRK